MVELFELVFYEFPAALVDLFTGLWVMLGFKPVLLGSDVLIYLLTFSSLVWLAFAMRREYWRTAFRQVAANRVAVLCFGILSLYAVIGFLDTLHFRDVTESNKGGGEIQSVLDRFCRTLTKQAEKTYSAPFAVYSFSKENITRADGTQHRGFPRLKFGGRHLGQVEERTSDVMAGLGMGLLFGGVLGAVVLALGWMVRKRSDRAGRTAASSGRFLWGWAGFFAVMGFAFAVPVLLGGKYHVLGTDKAGTDVFYMAIKGVRTGLVVGTLTTLIAIPFAILFGVLAGYFGGWVDDLIQYLYTTLGSIPDILLIAAAMLIFQIGMKTEETVISADKKLIYLCAIMGITSWSGLCRLLRAEVLKLKEIEYIQAADAFGVSIFKIIFRHLVPNLMHIVLISIILRFSGLVLSEAVLTYIGIGVDPSMQSWGNMINQARFELARDPIVWWSLVSAILLMFGLVLPANLLGDAVRDALDPRLRTR